jgi:glyoxylase-like metal-dependent hydrolase (beta-lactamase superfamily II)
MENNLTFSRRGFLELAALTPLLRLGEPFFQGAASGLAVTEQILPGLRLIKASVNTAVLERNGKKLLVDSGDLVSTPGGGVAERVLFTHHHRDQASGASRLAASGSRLVVPSRETQFFSDADGFWAAADGIFDHRYNFRPHLFTLRESVQVSHAVKGGDIHEWEGLKFEVIDTPGHTEGSVTYLVELEGKRVAFTGDLLCGPGQIWEIYSLQKRFPGMRGDYWGFGGAVEEVKSSLDRVLDKKPDLLIPSHGVVMTDPVGAVAQLKKNLDAVMDNYMKTAAWRIYFAGIYPVDRHPMMAPLPRVPYPEWVRHIASTTKAIVAEDKSIFISDCGHHTAIEELERLKTAGEIKSVDGVWITHYHDDHTEFVNAVRRRFGTKVYVQREMVDIIENPTAYQMPCLFPESIRVDRSMDHGETIQWKDFRLTAYHFPGQTLYHTGLLAEKNGFKVFFTGDSFANWGVDDYCSQNRCFSGRDVGYEKCFKILLDVKPDILMAAHWGPLPVSAEYLEKSLVLFQERERLYQKLFPHNDVNFGTDPSWIRAYPYRQKALPGAAVEIEARIMNHHKSPMRARVTLNLPKGWRAGPGRDEVKIPPRSEGGIRLQATSPANPVRRRDVLGLSASIDGQPLGEFAEAVVDYLV